MSVRLPAVNIENAGFEKTYDKGRRKNEKSVIYIIIIVLPKCSKTK